MRQENGTKWNKKNGSGCYKMLPDFRTTRTPIKEAKAAKEQRKNKERTKKRCPKMSRDFARDMKEIGKIGECVAGTVAEGWRVK